MQLKKQNLFDLSPAEAMTAPWWIRYILKTGKFSFLALLGAVFFAIMLLIGGEDKHSESMIGLIVCGAWLGLNFLVLHIGFLSDALRNRDMGYFSRMLVCGPLFWGDYFSKVMKPRLAQSNSEQMHPSPAQAKTKKSRSQRGASNPLISKSEAEGLLCAQCGSSKFDFDGYWKEYTCKKCGWVRRD